jgi:hypothetical protein
MDERQWPRTRVFAAFDTAGQPHPTPGMSFRFVWNLQCIKLFVHCGEVAFEGAGHRLAHQAAATSA